MKDIIRIFVALPAAEHISSYLQSRQSDWQRVLPFNRWVHPSDWHITLHFLGDTAQEQRPAIVSAMSETAAETKPFRLMLSSLGIFGNPAAPSVLWVGCSEPLAPLRDLQLRLGEHLSKTSGFRPEARPFRPHLTLARKFTGKFRFSDKTLVPFNEELRTLQVTWDADEIVLYQSHLGRSPMYEPIARVRLGVTP